MDHLLEIITGWGPSGVIAAGAIYLYTQERKDRIAAQKDLFDMGKRSVEADFTSAKSLDGLVDGIDSLVRTLLDTGQRRP